MVPSPQHIALEHFSSQSPIFTIGTPTPRLSWRYGSDTATDFVQHAYEIETHIGGVAHNVIIHSPQQVMVPWPFEDLHERQTISLSIRVSDGSAWSSWSEPFAFETGLMDNGDWRGTFISPVGIGGLDAPAPALTSTFALDQPVKQARLYATAHGIYQVTINGRRLDDTVLAPGWTSYPERLRYQAYDVTSLLAHGENTIEALLGNGWYRGHLGWEGKRAIYGDRLAFLAQLEITYDDDTTAIIATDRTWTAHNSVIIANDLYDGATIDCSHPADSTRYPVEELPMDNVSLVAPQGPSIRPIETRSAERIWTSPTGKILVDFGQNAVGWVRVNAHTAAPGSTVTIKHAEVIEHGELGIRPLRKAKATDTYLLGDDTDITLEPMFTLHGFRYIQVEGMPQPDPQDITMVIVGSELTRTGWFDCSDARLNRLHDNVVWSERGNFVDLPTDCPQRDERLGWTGDINIFSPTALSLFDVSGLLRSWLRDLAAEQFPDGGVPHVVPTLKTSYEDNPPAAAWGDAAVTVPWNIHWATGDQDVLAVQFPSMRAWVDKVESLLSPNGLWDTGFQFGDWLDPAAPPDNPAAARTPAALVATACHAHCTSIVAQAADTIGEADAARHYHNIARRVRADFRRAYVTAEGHIDCDSQTAYAMAVEWDLLDNDAQRRYAGERLAALARSNGYHVATGFVGTPLICDALTDTGHVDVAMRMLTETTCPSWLYPVSMGATTIWERWDSMLPDGSINPGEMTSFNHYSLGAVADWMHRTIAGLTALEPAYRLIRIAPKPLGDLTHASFTHNSPYGRIAVEWTRADNGTITVRAAIPVGVTAEVPFLSSVDANGADAGADAIRDGNVPTVGHGTYEWSVGEDVLMHR